MQPGYHTLVQIPKGAQRHKTLLSAAAKVKRVGAQCQDMYITQVNLTGAWPETAGYHLLQFQAGVLHKDLDSRWLRFGPVDLKVAHGRTAYGTSYLNFLVRNLAHTGYPVGGLLGEDDHSAVAKRGGHCAAVLNLAVAEAADAE